MSARITIVCDDCFGVTLGFLSLASARNISRSDGWSHDPDCRADYCAACTNKRAEKSAEEHKDV